MAKRELIRLQKILLGLMTDRGLSVSKICLLGSCAKGTMNKDSDIDMIVVSKDFRGKDIFEKVELTKGIHIELVKALRKPIDIIYYSDEEWRKSNSLIISAAKEEGVVLYAA